MNLKKYLQKLVEEEAEALITESDRLFIQQLVEKTVQSENKDEELLKNNKDNS